MKRKPNEILGNYFGLRLSPLFNEEGLVEEKRMNDEDFIKMYSKYIRNAAEYIRKNGMHLDGMVFEKYFTEPDYEAEPFEPVNLSCLRDVVRQKVFEVKRDSAKVYKTNKSCHVMIRDLSPDLRQEEELLMENTLQYKLSETCLNEDFRESTECVYLVVFRFGDLDLPFLLRNFGFDEFSVIRLKIQELFGIDHF